jgi:N6-L-threonylcarbamoyladenine synthase
MTVILAIESSCDDTAVAVVKNGRHVLASVRQCQTTVHAPYGGVIPELAARQHVTTINPLIAQALKQAGQSLQTIDAIAATFGPGLIGSLLVGVSTAKALSAVAGKPLIAVHHLRAHVASCYLGSNLEPPFVCLLVSGGHTQLLYVEAYEQITLIGQTLDDAVGEAYDKVARLMGLGFPGGALIDALAQEGEPVYALPKARTQNPFDFSFSGLKTATLRLWQQETASYLDAKQAVPLGVKANIAASFQKTVVDTLVQKVVACATSLGCNTVTVAGGVSANKALREALNGLQESHGYKVIMPAMAYCTDNAAMVGASAYFNPYATADTLSLDVFSRG